MQLNFEGSTNERPACLVELKNEIHMCACMYIHFGYICKRRVLTFHFICILANISHIAMEYILRQLFVSWDMCVVLTCVTMGREFRSRTETIRTLFSIHHVLLL